MIALALALIKAIRPRQWVKNTFVFAPLLFGKLFLRVDKVLLALLAFALFSAMASAVYLLNDIVDIERDRAHPTKRTRPIASGQLPIPVAAAAAFILAGAALTYSFVFIPEFGTILAVYAAINVGYSLGLKHIVIVDIFALASGFVLRVFGGAVALDVEASRWLLTCTIFISLFLGACKRRGELGLVGESTATRAVLASYSVGFIDQIINLSGTAAVLTYALYTQDPETITRLGTRDLIYTLPFVIYGILRYMHLVQHKGGGGSPTETLLRDHTMQLTVLGYVGLVVWFLLARHA
jgi:4-hydroxybenzoate polyprenyltransferase